MQVYVVGRPEDLKKGGPLLTALASAGQKVR